MCHINASMAKRFEREARKLDNSFVLVGPPVDIGGKEQVTVVRYIGQSTKRCFYGSVRVAPDDEPGEFDAQMAVTLSQLAELLKQEEMYQ